jgi:hypothetical protein
MDNNTRKIKRYPGVRSFEKNEAYLFIGRETEKFYMFNLILSERLTLLFSRSGIGKSSLINAGITPLLEDRGFFPLPVRLNKKSPADTPLSIVQETLKHFSVSRSLPAGVTEIKLWEKLKLCSFPLASVPVLIFDQFEQFFNFPEKDQIAFLLQLNEIAQPEIPTRILDWYTRLNPDQRTDEHAAWCSHPECKVLVAIRSDRLFELNRVANIVSSILRNKFELLPLSKDNALRAIEEPAGKSDPELFDSNPFGFKKKVLEDIITRLKGANEIIETTQLQIVCSEIEGQVINPPGGHKKPENYLVTRKDIVKIGGLENIVSNFYYNQVSKIGDENEQEMARILLEDELFDKENKSRKLLFSDQVTTILNKYKASNGNKKSLNGDKQFENNDLINKLLDYRLIREDMREGRKLYEISHDILLDPIERSHALREIQKEKDKLEKINRDEKRTKRYLNIMIVCLSLFLLVTLSFSVFYRKAIKESNKQFGQNIKYEAQRQYDLGFHPLAYALWKEVKNYIPGDTAASQSLAQNTFYPFISSKFDASSDQRFIASLQYSTTLIVWENNNIKINKKCEFQNIKYFTFLKNSHLLCTIDTGSRFKITDLDILKRIQFRDKEFDLDTLPVHTFSDIKFIRSGSFFYTDRHSKEHFFSIPKRAILTDFNRKIASLSNDSLNDPLNRQFLNDSLILYYKRKAIYLCNLVQQSILFVGKPSMNLVKTNSFNYFFKSIILDSLIYINIKTDDFQSTFLIEKNKITIFPVNRELNDQLSEYTYSTVGFKVAWIRKSTLLVADLLKNKIVHSYSLKGNVYSVLGVTTGGDKVFIEAPYDPLNIMIADTTNIFSIDLNSREGPHVLANKAIGSMMMGDNLVFLDSLNTLHIYNLDQQIDHPIANVEFYLLEKKELNSILFKVGKEWGIYDFSRQTTTELGETKFTIGRKATYDFYGKSNLIVHRGNDTVSIFDINKKRFIFNQAVGTFKLYPPYDFMFPEFIRLYDPQARKEILVHTDQSRNAPDSQVIQFKSFIDPAFKNLGINK